MDDTQKQQNKAQRTALFWGLGCAFLIWLILEWYATQSIAEQCKYNPLLGWNLALGGTHIYPPFGHILWSDNEKIAKAIPDILQGYSYINLVTMLTFGGVFYLMKQKNTVHYEHGTASWATAKDIIDSGLGDTVEIDDPKAIRKNDYWMDLHNLRTSFHVINSMSENSGAEKKAKERRWKNYWDFIKKNRPEDTKDQKDWDNEHNLDYFEAYANSLDNEEEKDAILLRISSIRAELDNILEPELREEWVLTHNIQDSLKLAKDYKDPGLRKSVNEKLFQFIETNRPKGTEEQQNWDKSHNLNEITSEIRSILEGLISYEKENRPKPETEAEIRRFKIQKNPKPTLAQKRWDMFHNLEESMKSIKEDKRLSDDRRQSLLTELRQYVKESCPAKDVDSKAHDEWIMRHNLKKHKKKYETLLEKYEKFISKNCPKPKKIKVTKDSGVVCGINPYTHKLMLHDGVEHILLMAPTRSGKGVSTIVPTGLIWKHSIFFFDPKGELWGLTSGYRKYVMRQKVLKFQPLCKDGSGARWNPLAEIDYRMFAELSDVKDIVSVMVRPDGEQKGGDSFWPDSAAALLTGVILHLLYQHDKEHRPLPCPTDIMSFLSSPDKTTEDLFTGMRDYQHISPEEFMEEPVLDKDGNKQYDKNGILIRRKNPLKEIYGEYIKDFSPFCKALGVTVRSLDEIRAAIKYKIDQGEKIVWEAEIQGLPSGQPYHQLLTHPKVAECAANMLNGADQTRASIMQTAQTAMAIYQDPVVQANTAVSDFAIRDLLDPSQEVSLYLVMEVKDIVAIKPLARLFVQMICSKLIKDMKFGKAAAGKKKQRLLLMLDEFPQLGNMKCIELALAICAGYGIKMCIVCQDVNQLNKEYTKDNSIGSNCHLHMYFTPNIDSGGATAEAISKTLGKRTISTSSHSDGGGLFKGSNTTNFTGRELMTPDEVSHMSSEKEIVFVAGHKPIFGDKLRYYNQPFLLKRTQIEPPAIADHVTAITSYAEMEAVHAAEAASKEAERLVVLEEKAKNMGMTLKMYLSNLEKERKQRENEVIRRITGDTEPESEDEEHCADTDPAREEQNFDPKRPADNGARAEGQKKIGLNPFRQGPRIGAGHHTAMGKTEITSKGNDVLNQLFRPGAGAEERTTLSIREERERRWQKRGKIMAGELEKSDSMPDDSMAEAEKIYDAMQGTERQTDKPFDPLSTICVPGKTEEPTDPQEPDEPIDEPVHSEPADTSKINLIHVFNASEEQTEEGA